MLLFTKDKLFRWDLMILERVIVISVGGLGGECAERMSRDRKCGAGFAAGNSYFHSKTSFNFSPYSDLGLSMI